MSRALLLFGLGSLLWIACQSHARSQDKNQANPKLSSERKDAYGDPLPSGAIARIGTLRYRLGDLVARNEVALSPDGKWLAAIKQPETIQLWELPAWIQRATVDRKRIDATKPVQFDRVAFTADSKRIAVYESAQHEILLFDVATGKLLQRLPLHEKTRDEVHLTFSPDEKTLVCTFRVEGENKRSRSVQVWDLTKSQLRHAIHVPDDSVHGRPRIAVSADGRWLVRSALVEDPARRGRVDGFFLEVWDLTTGKSVHKIDTEMPMCVLAFSADGKWLAASSGQSNLRIYDAASGKEQHNIRLRNDTVHHLEFSPDGRSFYAVNHQGQITRWNPATGKQTATYQAPNAHVARWLSFQPDGKLLAMSLFNGVHLWEVTTGKSLSPTGVPTALIGEVAFSPRGDLFVSSRDGMLAWWNPRTGAKLRDVKLDFSAFAARAISTSFNGDLYVAEPHGSSVTMSGAGEFLVDLDGSSGGAKISFFDAKTGQHLYDEDGAADGRQKWVRFFDADRKAASIQHKKVRIWNSRTGRDLSHFSIPLREQEEAIRFSVSPDGKHFAVRTASDQGNRVLIWDADQAKIVREWTAPPNRIGTILLSPDNQWLALAGGQEHVPLLRVGSAKGDVLLKPGDSMISQVRFSPDGRQFAVANVNGSTGGDDKHMGRVVVYELASKQVRLELVGHPNGIVQRLAYAHDSGLLATGASDTTVLVWQAGLRAFRTSKANLPSPSGRGAEGEGEGEGGVATHIDLAHSFQAMTGTNAKTAFQHMIQLVRTPTQTVNLLNDKILPAKQPDRGGRTIPQWIDDLGSGQFAVRSKASAMLQKIGRPVEGDLRAALPRKIDLEMKRRIEELLDRIAAREWTAEEVAHARAVEVLDAIATPEARALLMRWAGGYPSAVLTREAVRALRGMK